VRPPLLLLLCTLMLASCLPGTGSVTILGDGVGAADGALVADGGADTGPLPDRGPLPDGTLPDLKPTPDQPPVGPAPPFGSSVGMTAANFQNVPDCDGTLYALHPYYGKKKGVLIAMMSPS